MGANAAESNRLVGERMVADEVEWLGKKAGELLAEYERLQPVHNFTTFETVEQVWREVVAPEFAGFQSMQLKWPWQEDLPGESPWAKNNPVPDNWR